MSIHYVLIVLRVRTGKIPGAGSAPAAVVPIVQLVKFLLIQVVLVVRHVDLEHTARVSTETANRVRAGRFRRNQRIIHVLHVVPVQFPTPVTLHVRHVLADDSKHPRGRPPVV